ncbi:MAG TPA: iron-sulfur cluster assembly scaffold protein [Steroidobacteraceae bacterium]
MTDPQYHPLVVEHFANPRNAGRLEPGPDVVEGAAGRLEDGVHFVLTARIEGERVAEVRVEVYGCPHCVAAASWLSERLIGASRADLEAWSWREAARSLEVPAVKRGRLLILEDSVRALARAWAGRS